uniref:endopeptidase La n=1 Tax=Biomphalaria glabrata TaxID=6526 RepID=A0A2C9JN79_BIOGL
MMSPMSAEATVIRGYIDWIISIPWNNNTTKKNSLKIAKEILDAHHYGMQDVKERILEYLSVQQRVKKQKCSVICLVGPPGVGKTSLAQSISMATGRKFTKMSLGGVRDEAEVRGHRKTYTGSLPGKIIQCMKKAGTSNPVFLLDEIDKMSFDFRGDPASALLEVLDFEHNYAFIDNYLEIEYDISNVMFIATANTLSGIPMPLASVAMTGEITLSGRVLAIGGLKEKLLGAIRGNIKTVLIPKENQVSLSEISSEITEKLNIILVDQMTDVIEFLFGEKIDNKEIIVDSKNTISEYAMA